jgi:hypothetical protein
MQLAIYEAALSNDFTSALLHAELGQYQITGPFPFHPMTAQETA